MQLPTLVLLPGMDGSGELFQPFVDSLGSAVRSIVVNYNAPMTSSYEGCRAIARAALPKDGPFILVGESFSGPIAVSTAATRPAGLCGVVLVGSFVSSPSAWLKWMVPLMRFSPVHHASGSMDSTLLGRFATPERRRQLAQALRQIPAAVFRARLAAIASVDVSEELTKVTVPILYLRATEDRLVPGVVAEKIASRCPGVRIQDIVAPHLLLHCAPREAAEAVLRFAAE